MSPKRGQVSHDDASWTSRRTREESKSTFFAAKPLRFNQIPVQDDSSIYSLPCPTAFAPINNKNTRGPGDPEDGASRLTEPSRLSAGGAADQNQYLSSHNNV
jgi:hypothetical protein